MRKVFILYFLAFSLLQGFLHDGREILRPGNLEDLLRFKQALSPGDILSIPEPTPRFSREIANHLTTPFLRQQIEGQFLACRTPHLARPASNRDPQRLSANLHPWEWGLIAPLFPRGDG